MTIDFIIFSFLQHIDFDIPFIFSYVDDTLTVVPRNKLGVVLSLFNRINPHLQFTMKLETRYHF